MEFLKQNNRTILEMATSMLDQSKVDKYFWVEAIKNLARFKQSLNQKYLNKTTYEFCKGKKPNIAYF